MWILIVLISAVDAGGQPSNDYLSSVAMAEFNTQEACGFAANKVLANKQGVEAFCVPK